MRAARTTRAPIAARTAARLVAGILGLVASVPPAPAAAQAPSRSAAEYDVTLVVDLLAASYSGSSTVRFTNRSGGGLEELYFHLLPNAVAGGPEDRLLTVTSVTIAGAPAETRDEMDGLVVRLGRELESGRSVEIAMAFEGRLRRYGPSQLDLTAHVTDQVTTVLEPTRARPRTGAELMPATETAALLANPFPLLAALDGRDWQKRAADADARAQVLAADFRVTVEEPRREGGPTSSFRASGYGLDPAESIDTPGSHGPVSSSERTIGAFRGEGLRSFAVAAFPIRGTTSFDADVNGARVEALHRPEHAAAGKRAFDALVNAVRTYSELYGALPLKKYTLVEAPLPPGVPAVSFGGLIAVASAYYTDIRGKEGETLPGFLRETPDLMEGALELAVAHEVAHFWWGESVGYDPEEAPFLGEALASYSAIVAIERAHGAEAAEQAVEQHLRSPYRVYRMFGGDDHPVGEPAERFPNYFAAAAILQSKGGLWLASVREALGDERFFQALRDFHTRFAGRAARPQDLLQALTPSAQADRGRLERLHKRWLRERFGDADVATPEFAVRTSSGKSGFERFGRFVVRNLARVGKAAAKPF